MFEKNNPRIALNILHTKINFNCEKIRKKEKEG